MSTHAISARDTPFSNIILAVILTGFVASTYGFGVYLFANLVVDMRRDLNFDYTTAGLITGGAQIGFLAFSFATSYISRYCQGWKISLISTLITALSLLGLSISHNVVISAVLLIILGGCSASVYIPLAEIVTKRFPANKRARVMGLISSGTSYGVFINGLLVSLLMSNGGWRSIWLTAGLISLGLCLAAYFCLRNSAHAPLSQKKESGHSVVLSDAHWISRPLWLLWIIAFLNGLTLLPFQTYLAPYMRDELGISVQDTGLVWSTIGAVGMASGFLVGWIADRIGTRAALIICFASACAGSLIVFTINTIPAFYIAAVFFALAFYPIFGLVPTYIGQIVPVSRLTQAFGIANVLIGLGGMCGNFVGGASKDTLGTFAPVYLAVALLLLLQMLIAIILPKRSL